MIVKDYCSYPLTGVSHAAVLLVGALTVTTRQMAAHISGKSCCVLLIFFSFFLTLETR
jgi:hypothetical protein